MASTKTRPGAVAERFVDLARALRRQGVTVGTSEVADAAAVAQALGLTDRERLRAGIAAAMMRRAGDRVIFDQLFDLYFPKGVGARHDDGSPTEPLDAAALREALTAALAADDEAALERLAAQAVADLGALANEASTGSWSAHQALDRLAPQTAIAPALQRARDAGRVPGGAGEGEGGGGTPQDGSGAQGQGGGAGPGGGPARPWQPARLTERIDRDEMRGRVAAFRRRVEREAARRNAEVRGRERIARYGVRAPLERREFLLTGAADAAELQAVIAPLSRKLAARMAARQRRHSRGGIDVRRTLRAAMSTGGVPVRPVHRRRTRSRADLVLICDLSGSVSGFSRFTMLLLQALAGQFRRVRFFGFVNICDEITDIVREARPGEDISRAVAEQATLTRWHGSSDYGSALVDFAARHLDAVGPRSTVMILGDARTNGTDPQADALREILARARTVLWLNPEPAARWDSGDSVASTYAEIVDMHECRDVEQLRQLITRLPVA